MKKLVFAGILLFLSVISGFAETRQPAVAGAFYPADKAELAFQVNKLLGMVPAGSIEGDIIALIVPHAGYFYSGKVAAGAYKELAGRKFSRVILIGTSHKAGFDYLAVPAYDNFATPLGNVPVDQDFIRQMIKISQAVVYDNKPHQDEYALEVQLPFLQTELQDFKIVPVLFGNTAITNCQTLSYILSLLVDDGTLVIASSDLSHYYASPLAQKLDNKGIGLILQGDIPTYVRALAEQDTEACGAPAIVTTMLLVPALGANKTELLSQANSGDETGDKTRVVGYASIAFVRQETLLSGEEEKRLLRLARQAIRYKLSNWKLPERQNDSAGIKEPRGAFVTLTNQGKLRGCIGYITPVKPLVVAVQEMAVQAASNDGRFAKVSRKELNEIDIEISALSRLKKVNAVAEIEVGRDGLYILNGSNSGILLPQVAVEWGWDRAEFLRQVCLKAGLAEDAWQDSNSTLYRFSAQVFRE